MRCGLLFITTLFALIAATHLQSNKVSMRRIAPSCYDSWLSSGSGSKRYLSVLEKYLLSDRQVPASWSVSPRSVGGTGPVKGTMACLRVLSALTLDKLETATHRSRIFLASATTTLTECQ